PDRSGRLLEPPGHVFLRTTVAHREDRPRLEAPRDIASRQVTVLAPVGAADPANLATFPGPRRIHELLREARRLFWQTGAGLSKPVLSWEGKHSGAQNVIGTRSRATAPAAFS